MQHSKRLELIRELAKTTNVSEEDVKKVLEHLGLSEALKAVEASGVPADNIDITHAKIAFRLGKNTIVV